MKRNLGAVFTLTVVLMCVFGLLAYDIGAAEPQEVFQTLTLRERLNVGFKHELVHFNVPNLPAENVQMQDGDGHLIPFQRIDSENIAFVTDLDPLEKRTFYLVRTSKGSPATGVTVLDSEDGQCVVLENGRIAVRLARDRSEAVNGPIAGIRLSGGNWIGEGKLSGEGGATDYTLEVVHRGPVFTEAVCRYRFGDRGNWQVRIRLIAGEPSILISESSSLGPQSKVTWSLSLQPASVRPINRSLYRVCVGSSSSRGSHHIERFPAGRGGTVNLTAWYTWWSGKATTAAAFFHLPEDVRYVHEEGGLTRIGSAREAMQSEAAQETEELLGEITDDPGDGGEKENKDVHPDLKRNALVVAVGRPAQWVRKSGKGIGGATMPARIDASGKLKLSMPLNRRGREWLIGTGRLEEIIVPDRKVALPQRLYAKHLGTSLAMIQKMDLDWPTDLFHPTLIFDRETYESYPLERVREADMLWGSRGVISRYYFNRDPEARENNAAEARGAAQQVLRYPMSWFLPRAGHCRTVAENQAPHELGQALYKAAATADFILGTDALTESQKRTVLARLAFLCHRGSDPNIINHAKGLRNFPNMSIFTYVGVGMCAMVIPRNPDASEWTRFVVSRIQRDLRQLSGPNGGWAEAPHYQGAAMDGFMWFGLAARHAGLSDIVHDERLRDAVRFLAKLSTPPDPRFHNRRHLPPIGNTYTFETSSQFGIMASIWRDRDREFGETMQWMWQEQGLPENMGVGGDAGIHWHAHMLLDPEWHAGKPLDLSSELFPKFGAALRSHHPSGRETYMPYHVGPWLYHYDRDMGSITLWGKGRVLSADWGYAGHMPAWQHNRVLLGRSGRMVENGLTPAADYLHGRQSGWHRQVLFIKSEDSGGPTWFLLRDWLDPDTKSSKWWYWLYTRELPRLRDGAVLQKGTDDVDCEIWFAGDRADELPRLTNREWATQRKTGKGPDIQNALDAGEDDGLNADEGMFLGEDGPADPDALSDRIDARKLSIRCAATGKRGAEVTTQYGLNLPISVQKPVVWALWPRFRKQQSPEFQPLAENAGVKVTHGEGIDYAFLAPDRMTWRDEDAVFSGTAGAIQVREDSLTLTLAAEGKLRYAGHQIQSTGPAVTREFPR